MSNCQPSWEANTEKTVNNGLLTAYYGMKLCQMVTSLLQSLHICVSVPDQHFVARAAVFEPIYPNEMVKIAIFTEFHGILS